VPEGTVVPFGFPLNIFAYGWSRILGGDTFEAERQKLFADHRARNEARGWKAGDNILRATQQGTIEERRAAAERAISQVDDWYRRAPTVVRKKGRQRPRPAPTAKEVRENEARAARDARNEQIKGLKKEAARTRSVVGFPRPDVVGPRGVPGIAGPVATGQVTADLLQVITENLIVDAFERKRARRLRHEQLLRTNRRGALATRAFQPRGATNRRGSLATRPIEPVSTAPAQRTGQQSQRPTSTRAVERGQTTQGTESQASKDARTIMGTSPKLPTATATRLPTITQQLLGAGTRLGLASLFRSSPSSRLSSTSSLPGMSTPVQSIPGLTALNSVGVGSQTASQKCDCPKPAKKKQKKNGEPRCVNPVLSRTEKDGIRTTKVKLTCPPSKQKSLSALV
jgi:hypothetical protein